MSVAIVGDQPGINQHILGWDGSIWDLRNGDVWLTGDEVIGLGMPEFDARIRESPRSHGQQLMGYRFKPRDVLLPLFVGRSESPEAWEMLDGAWWSLWAPDRTNWWSVQGPAGKTRYLAVRYQSDGGYGLTEDPSLRRWQALPLRLMADDPLWYGPVVRKDFTIRRTETDPHFLGGGNAREPGAGTPIVITPSTRNDRLYELVNEGEFPTYPRWTIRGPINHFFITVGGRLMEADAPLLLEEELVIDTDPTKLTAVVTNLETGARRNVSPQIGRFDFGAIPVGGKVPVEVVIDGTGSVSVQYRPIYKKAWGRGNA